MASFLENVAGGATLLLGPKIFNGLAGLLAKATGGEIDLTKITEPVDHLTDKATSIVADGAANAVSTGLHSLGNIIPTSIAAASPNKDGREIG